MDCKTDNQTFGCTFQWKLENISHCWSEAGEKITSPYFIANDIHDTKWLLELFLSGNYVVVYLCRANDCRGPSKVYVSVVLAFLDKAGYSLSLKKFECEYKNNCYGQSLSEDRRKVFVMERDTFLPDDTLTVQCNIWKRGKTYFGTKSFFARTIWKVNHRYFDWKIKKFSTVQPGVKGMFKDDLLNFIIVLKEGLDVQRKLIIDIQSLDKSIKYISFKTAIRTSKEKKEYCGKHEYFKDDLKAGMLTTLISSDMLMENEDRYLPNDVLSLYCEFLYSTGTISDQFCSWVPITSHKIAKVNPNELEEDCDEKTNMQPIPVLVNDMKFMFEDNIFSDINLRTSTNTFPVHRSILSARSPVFRRMFSNHMKESISGFVDINDLEDEIVHQMLLYIYTDTLEDLQFEHACKLYEGADKYEILSLRNRCSSFLKANLSHNKALDVLVLADRHQDEDLKSHVENFILSSDKDLFGSQEWKQFMTRNLQLAADIMHRKIYPG